MQTNQINRTFDDYFKAVTASVSVTGNKRHMLVFHHSDNDGFTAAACAYQAYLNNNDDNDVSVIASIEFIPVNYGTYKDEDILDKIESMTHDVWVLDFSFSEELSEKINAKAGFFVTIDHHASAQRAIGDKPYAIFDMNSSGALMAYQYFIGKHDTSKKVPLLVTLVDNRDLWKKDTGLEDFMGEALIQIRHKHGENICNYLDELISMMDDESMAMKAVDYGRNLRDRLNSSVAAICKPHNLIETTIGGHKAVLVNSPLDQSDICEYLYSQDKYSGHIAGAFSVRGDKVTFSIRKNKSLDIDLGALAENSYGGGGHKAAAGFSVPLKRAVDIFGNKEKWALCWKTDAVDKALLCEEPYEAMSRLLATPSFIRSRAVCETDDSTLQILPYLVVRDKVTGKYFAYNRPAGGTETRLHGKDSIGLGGHVDTVPKDGNLAKHLADEAVRELQEEVGLKSTDVYDQIYNKIRSGEVVFLRITTTPVESVHLGLGIVVDANVSDMKSIEETEVANARWLTVQELTDLPNPEVWTAVMAEVINLTHPLGK